MVDIWNHWFFFGCGSWYGDATAQPGNDRPRLFQGLKKDNALLTAGWDLIMQVSIVFGKTQETRDFHVS